MEARAFFCLGWVRFAPARVGVVWRGLACWAGGDGRQPCSQVARKRRVGGVPDWHLALFCTNGWVEHCGRFWNVAEERRGARGAEEAGGWKERQGAEGAKDGPCRGWILWAHVGPPVGPGGGAGLGPLLRTRNEELGVLLGNCGVGFFYFGAEGGLRGSGSKCASAPGGRVSRHEILR